MGRIYIDPSCDAIVGLDYRLEIIIPLVVKPLLFAFGMAIDRPHAMAKIRYQRIGDLYFPHYFRRQIKIHLKKKYLWAKNEDSYFFGEQLFRLTAIDQDDPSPIPKEKRFDPNKAMSEQAQNDEELSWKNINTLKFENIQARKVKW